MPDVVVECHWNILLMQWDLMLGINGTYLMASVPLWDVHEDRKAVYRKFVQMIEKWQGMQNAQQSS